jgi:hypothetical protein
VLIFRSGRTFHVLFFILNNNYLLGFNSHYRCLPVFESSFALRADGPRMSKPSTFKSDQLGDRTFAGEVTSAHAIAAINHLLVARHQSQVAAQSSA